MTKMAVEHSDGLRKISQIKTTFDFLHGSLKLLAGGKVFYTAGQIMLAQVKHRIVHGNRFLRDLKGDTGPPHDELGSTGRKNMPLFAGAFIKENFRFLIVI